MVLLSLPTFAGDVARKGTTGADQLLIPVGARGIATGGAMLSSLTGLESIYYNPAGLDISGQTEGMFSHMTYIADINISYFAVGTSLGDIGSFALSFKTIDFGDIPVTTYDNPDGTGFTYSPSYITLGLTYSKIITDRVAIGFNAKLISESIMQTSATGFGLDFGVQYRFNNNLSLGASVKNIGTNMNYTGHDLQYRTDIPDFQPGTKPGDFEATTEAFQLPSFFELSAGYNFTIDEQNKLHIAAAFVNNNAFEDEVKLGAEYGFMDMFYLRGGYQLYTENTDNNIFGLTFGAGVDYSMDSGIDFTLDYAFRDVKEFANPNHVFTIKVAFNN